MVYILTITTITEYGTVEHEIHGVFLTMERLDEELSLLKKQDRKNKEKHKITYKRHYNVIREYLRG